MVSVDGRWTIRGIHEDLQALVTTRAMIEKKTVGEIVSEALAAYLGRPVEADVTAALVERLNAMEARIDEMQAARPTVVGLTREEVSRPSKGRGGYPPETIELVKKLRAEGQTQRQMAVAAGISQGGVSNILNGKSGAKSS